MIVVNNDLTPIDRKIISAIKDIQSEHIVLQNIAFDSAESIKDMHGNVFVKQRTGEWIRQNPMVDTEECSKCGWNILSNEMETSYCPNCGAKMIALNNGLTQ